MYSHEQALRDIFSCIEMINEQLPADDRIVAAAGTKLVGDGVSLESLTLINLIVEIEERVAVSSGTRLAVLDTAVMTKGGAQFSTVGELAQWIVERV